MSNNPYQQPYNQYSGYPQPTPPPNQQNADKEGKWSWRDWLVKVCIPILVALIGAGVIFGVKGNTPTTPQLHTTYSGHLTSVSGTTSFFATGVNENSDGSFRATGTDGSCPMTIDNGKVSSDNTISFEVQETQIAGCGFTAEFKGTIRSDGSISGTWNVPNTQTQGSWDLS